MLENFSQTAFTRQRPRGQTTSTPPAATPIFWWNLRQKHNRTCKPFSAPEAPLQASASPPKIRNLPARVRRVNTSGNHHEARTALVNDVLPVYLTWLQNQLLANGGEYFADKRLTIADLKVFVDVRGLNSGRLDHVPADLVEKVAPALNAHMRRIAQTPAIAQYYTQFTAR